MRFMIPLRLSAPLLAAGILLAAASAGLTQGAAAPAPAESTPPSAAQAVQRDRMARCNADAGTRALASEARRDLMRDCLAGKTPSAPAATGGRRG